MVVVRLVAISVVVVLTTSVELTQLLVEYCHFTILPVCPDNVNVVLLLPEQTVAEPAIEPPTETGSTVTVASLELAVEHTPLCTTARYFVVAVRSVATSVVVVLATSVELTQLLVEYCHFTTFPV